MDGPLCQARARVPGKSGERRGLGPLVAPVRGGHLRIAKKFTLVQTALLAWFVGFVFMWIVIGNLGVLPYGLLAFAIPLSLLEAFVAALIVKKLA